MDFCVSLALLTVDCYSLPFIPFKQILRPTQNRLLVTHPATQVARNLCTNSLRQECLCVLYVLVTVAHVGSILHILTLRHLIPAIPLVYFGISTNFLGKFCNAVLCPECCLRGEEVAKGKMPSHAHREVL